MHSNVSFSTLVLVLTKYLYLCTKLSFEYMFLTFSVKKRRVRYLSCIVRVNFCNFFKKTVKNFWCFFIIRNIDT